MRDLFVLCLALLGAQVLATERVHTPMQQSQSLGQQQTANGGNAVGGNVSGGDAWAVALPGHGSPSYAGLYSICVKGRGIFFNAFWTWEPDQECIKMIADVDRMRAMPYPVRPVVYPMADSVKPVVDERQALYERALTQVRCGDKARAHKPTKPVKVALNAGCGK